MPRAFYVVFISIDFFDRVCYNIDICLYKAKFAPCGGLECTLKGGTCMSTKNVGTEVRFFEVGGRNVKVELGPYDIIDGPSFDRLLDALKYEQTGVKVPVSFSVAVGYTMPINDPGCAIYAKKIEAFRVYGVSCNLVNVTDPTGANYKIIYGACKVGLAGLPVYDYKFKAEYNIKTRKGTIMFGE